MFITAVKILNLVTTSTLLRVGVLYIACLVCVQSAVPLSCFLVFSSAYLQWYNGLLPHNEKILLYSK